MSENTFSVLAIIAIIGMSIFIARNVIGIFRSRKILNENKKIIEQKKAQTMALKEQVESERQNIVDAWKFEKL